MWVISDVISRKGGGGEDRGKRSFEFGEELTGNLGRQESNGPRGRAGILIELVSVRAGASKAWRTTERLLAGAGWDPPGKHPLGFPCKISLCIPGPHQASQPAPHLHPDCSCLPATAIIPRNTQRYLSGFMGTSAELGVGPTCPSLPGCQCHPSPVPSIHSPKVFPC